MSASLEIDLGDPTPPYEQLRRQLVALISSGELPVGDRLPPLRQLAGDLGLAVGTVARAYRELEAAGLVVSRRGAGTRVATTPPRDANELEAASSAFILRARASGASIEQALDAVRRAWN